MFEGHPPQGGQCVREKMAMKTDGAKDPSLQGESEVSFDLVEEVWTLLDVSAPSESFCTKRWTKEQ